jgi:hypothetical protein
MQAHDPIEVLRQTVKRERDRCGDAKTVRFDYKGGQPVSVIPEAFFSFLDEKLKILQRLIAVGDTEQAVVSTINFMSYLGAFRDAHNMPELIQETRSLTAARGGAKKRGAEGPLKRYVRDVVDDGAKTFDQVLAALEYHPMIAEVTGDSLTYEKPNGSLKTVKLKAVEKAYREIIKNS